MSSWQRAEVDRFGELSKMFAAGQIEVRTIETHPWDMGASQRWFEWRYKNAPNR